MPALRAALVAWYARGHRDLPWRRTRDPYAVWVSEIMLQQTRVDTVVPYYERFLATLPTVHALADAPVDEVLRLWSGLGYYRRARLLHQGAHHVVREHRGHVPADVESLRRVPGVGRYTAGAIASIAFDRAAPLVDGNVARVLSRVFALASDPKTTKAQRVLWALAEQLVAGGSPGALNQALMELGATVCTPRTPACAACPARSLCVACAAGLQDELPRTRRRKAPQRVRLAALVVEVQTGERGIVLAKRRSDALFGGLWEPPLLDDVQAAARRFDLPVRRLEARGSVVHVLSHRRMEIDVFCTRVRRAPRLTPFGDYERVEVVGPADLEGLALSALARRILRSSGLRD